jgi:hypothetical protein
MLGLHDDDISAYPWHSKYHINLGAGGGTRGIKVLTEMYVWRGCDLDPVGMDSHLLLSPSVQYKGAMMRCEFTFTAVPTA